MRRNRRSRSCRPCKLSSYPRDPAAELVAVRHRRQRAAALARVRRPEQPHPRREHDVVRNAADRRLDRLFWSRDAQHSSACPTRSAVGANCMVAPSPPDWARDGRGERQHASQRDEERREGDAKAGKRQAAAEERHGRVGGRARARTLAGIPDDSVGSSSAGAAADRVAAAIIRLPADRSSGPDSRSARPASLTIAMLEAHDLAARRGTARLFAGLGFRVDAGSVARRDRRERTRQDDAAAHARGPDDARIGRDPPRRRRGRAVLAGAPQRRRVRRPRAGAQGRIHGARRTCASLVELSGAPAGRRGDRRGARARSRSDRAAHAARARALAGPAPPHRARAARAVAPSRLDSSTSRSPRSTPPGAALLAHLVAHHLDGGGLAVAATHAPLGLPAGPRPRALARLMTTPAPRSDDDGETAGALAGLALGAARATSSSRSGRARNSRVQLLFYAIVVTLFPLATTPERTLLATMGPGRAVGRRAARVAPVAAAALRARSSRRHAGADGAVAVAAAGASCPVRYSRTG